MNNAQYPRSFPVDGPINVSVRLGAGNVRIVATNANEAVVDLQPGDANDKSLKVIERSRVDLSANALRVDVPRTNSSMFTGRTPAVDADITVPLNSTVRVEVGSADVVLKGGLDDVSVTSGSGDVNAASCRDISVKTGSGDIAVDDGDAVKAHSGSGDVNVRRCTGRINAQSASGDIDIDHIHADSRAKTSSGDVSVGTVEAGLDGNAASGDVKVGSAASGHVSVSTASGGVVIGVPHGTAAHLDCSSVTGRLTSELDDADAPGEEERKVAVAVRTVSGSIRIVRSSH